MMGLPVVFSLLFLGITSRSRRERLSLFLAFVVCGGVSVEFWNLNRKYSRFAENITIINRTNLTFGSMLPFHRDRNAALRSVGLPESCADFIGMDAYNPIMSEVPCKEIHSVSHADIVFALLREPLFFAQYLGHGLFKVRDPLLAILGKVSEPNYPHQPWSVYSFWDDIRDYNRVFLLCVAMFLGVASVPRWKRDVLLSLDKKVLDMVSLLAAATVAYTYVSAVLGDGYIALNQHFHLGFAFLPFCFLSVVFYLLGKLFRCFPRDHEKSQQ
jgi:hypothetical protein